MIRWHSLTHAASSAACEKDRVCPSSEMWHYQLDRVGLETVLELERVEQNSSHFNVHAYHLGIYSSRHCSVEMGPKILHSLQAPRGCRWEGYGRHLFCVPSTFPTFHQGNIPFSIPTMKFKGELPCAHITLPPGLVSWSRSQSDSSLAFLDLEPISQSQILSVELFLAP